MRNSSLSPPASLITLLDEIYTKDDKTRSQEQSVFGKMVLERFRLVLREFEHRLWILDSECSWAVFPQSYHLTHGRMTFVGGENKRLVFDQILWGTCWKYPCLMGCSLIIRFFDYYQVSPLKQDLVSVTGFISRILIIMSYKSIFNSFSLVFK